MKNMHGKPSTFNLKPNKITKPLMLHKTLFHIKTRTNGSGNEILLIAKILNKSGMKVEAGFQNALFEKNHALEDFFEIETGYGNLWQARFPDVAIQCRRKSG